MSPSDSSPALRLVSLDVVRGLTIAGMILVNNPGSWSAKYAPLGHAQWHGWTPTDLVFPFFLFIVGVALTFSFDKRMAAGHSRGALFAQVVRRTLIIFLLGLSLAALPDWRLAGPCIAGILGVGLWFSQLAGGSATGPVGRVLPWAGLAVLLAAVLWFSLDFAHFQACRLRVPGVLQRIAICYFVASCVVLLVGVRGRVLAVLTLLAGYWLVVAYVPPPADYSGVVVGPEGRLHDWLDVQVLGDSHLYSERPDPEGLLSTLPAIATVLLGALSARWLRARRSPAEMVVGLFIAANVLMVAGCFAGYWLPINKKIWTPAYTLFTGGLALHVLAMCYWLIDVRGVRRWAVPFVVFGTNAIAVYFASSLTAKMLGRWKLESAGGTQVSVKQLIYETIFVPIGDALDSKPAASLAYALTYVALWCVLLIPLYRRRIFIKV